MYQNYLARNKDYEVNEHIVIRQPTVTEILDYGEQKYWQLVGTLCATPSDAKHVLFDNYNLYFDEIDDFTVFRLFIKSFNNKDLSILFKKFNIDSLIPGMRTDIDEIVLYNPANNMVFDKAIYEITISYLREMHNFKKNSEMPGNIATRTAMIDLSRDDYEIHKNDKFNSVLIPQGMFLYTEGKETYDAVWNMPIYIFSTSYQITIKNKYADSQIKAFYNNYYSSINAQKDFVRKKIDYSGVLN